MTTDAQSPNSRLGFTPAEAPRELATVERYRRFTRWLHVAVYLTVLTLMATGTWLLIGREGDPSLLSRLTGVSDAHLHVWTGWALAGILVIGLALGLRRAASFVAESVRFQRGIWPGFAAGRPRFSPGGSAGMRDSSTPVSGWRTLHSPSRCSP